MTPIRRTIAIRAPLLACLLFFFTPVLGDTATDSFQEVVNNYLAANPKPQVPEEARKFRVQAELAVEQKQFELAALLLAKALGIAPWWPTGHFNRAVILGELKQYPEAIQEMKRYLLLVPDAPDARAARDNIYRWELGADTAKEDAAKAEKLGAEAAAKAIKKISCETTGFPTRSWMLTIDFARHTVTHGQGTYSYWMADGQWRWKEEEDSLVVLFRTAEGYGGQTGADTFWSQRNFSCVPL